MKTAALLKRTPTVFVVAFLAYECYSVHASLPDSTSGRTELTKSLDLMIKDLVSASASEVQTLKGSLRDPFRIILKTVNAAESKTTESSDDSEAEFLAQFVSGLKLDATFLQGRSKIAIIGGRMYNQGQQLIVEDEKGKPHSPLLVQKVQWQQVTLNAQGKNYELRYPDQLRGPVAQKGRGPGDGATAQIDPNGQLALLERLLGSSLGMLGNGMGGSQGSGTARPRRGRR